MALLRLILVVAAACVLVAEARPRYVLVPLVDITPVRHTRSLRYYQPAQSRQGHEEYAVPVPVVHKNYAEEELVQVPQASDLYHQPSHHYDDNDHVDYGAYTGGYGAFGWYSDHPVCVNCGLYH